MDAIRQLPFAAAFAALFVIVLLRAGATYCVGRAALTGGRRSGRVARVLDGPRAVRATALVQRYGAFAVPLCFLTVGAQTAVHLTAGAARMPMRRYLPGLVVGSLVWAGVYAVAGTAVLTMLWDAAT